MLPLLSPETSHFKVITGFNTDIEFEGKTYHVQTEDKGLAKPVILSLIYDRGTILASKRSPYEDIVVDDSVDEGVLSERLNKQHRLICAAVRTGRIDDLIRMTRNGSSNGGKKAEKKPSESVVTAQENAAEPVFAPVAAVPEEELLLETASAGETVRTPSSQPIEFDLPSIPPPPRADADADECVIAKPIDLDLDAYEIIEEEIIIPDEAVEIVSEMIGKERPVNNNLTVELLGDSKFKGGEHKTVTFMVCRGSQRKVIGDAQVMVKILGSTFRPMIFHARTDINGIARINLQFPSFREGRAALLVRASSDGEEIELRRVVAHG